MGWYIMRLTSYIDNIENINISDISCYFNLNNDYFITLCINNKYFDYKLYNTNKGYYINYNKKRYYIKNLIL